MKNKSNFDVIVDFLKTDYCDESLQKLLTAAQQGKIVYFDATACLVGRSDKLTVSSTVFSEPAKAYHSFEHH